MSGLPDEEDAASKAELDADKRTTRLGSHPMGPDLPDTALHALQHRYDVLAEIGRGAMGIVYKARDRETGDVVAVKVLRPEIAAQADLVERFKSELLLARKITHKNVCRVYELNRFGNVAAISMEYVRGERLRTTLASPGGVSLRRGLNWARQICAALAEAHSEGVIHRDLKPENIVISDDGTVKVMDFGLARSVEVGTTTAGAIVGTPTYMSPEQAQGKTVDTRTDIYSLGVILYEMFTGKAPFGGETGLAVLHQQIHEIPPTPSEVDPTIPRYIEGAILRCLQKDPAKRFQSAEELEEALTKEPAPARPTQMPLLLVLSAVLVFLLGTGLAYLLYKSLFPPTQPSYHRLTFRRGTITSAGFHADGHTVVYSAAWEGEPSQLFQTRPESPESRPLDLKEYEVLSISQTGEMLLTNKESTLARAPFNGGAPREVRKEVEWADWAPNGRDYAVVYDAEGNDRLEFPLGKRLCETTGWITDMRVSPRGDLIAFLEHPILDDERGSVALVDLNTNKKTLTREYLNARGLAWSPRGDEVWFTAAEAGRARALYAVTLSGDERLVVKTPGTLRLHDISASGDLLLELANERGLVRGLFPGDTNEQDLSWLDYSVAADLSEDGKELLFDEEGEGGGARHSVYVRRTDGSPAVRLGDGIAEGFSPDGRWAISILDTPPRKVVLLPTSAGELKPLSNGGIEEFYSAEWFPDGKRLLLTGNERQRKIRCYIQNIDGGNPSPITPEGTCGLLISPDGKTIIALGPHKKVLQYPVTGGQPAPIPELDQNDELIRFSGDGRYLYTYQRDKSVTKVFRLDVTSRTKQLWKEIRKPDPVVDTIDRVMLTPDGKSYICGYNRALSDLYLVKGLK